MASLFAPKQINPTQIQGTTPLQQTPIIQNNSNAIDYAQSMLLRSGGDAKAAFYLAAQEKGIDPNVVINQVKGMGDLKSMAQNMLMSNPQAKKLASLFSMIK